jgi:hypothetical protein
MLMIEGLKAVGSFETSGNNNHATQLLNAVETQNFTK